MTGYRLCDNCALKYADCKGNKDKEKCRCEYYKKPIVMNVKELAERVAELEIKLKDSVEVVRCKDCYHAEDDITHMFCVYFHHKVYEDDYCSNAVERREESEVEE